MTADKTGDARKVRGRIACDRLKHNIVLAFPFDVAAGSITFMLGEQYDY